MDFQKHIANMRSLRLIGLLVKYSLSWPHVGPRGFDCWQSIYGLFLLTFILRFYFRKPGQMIILIGSC